jgi:hypothetical protein
LIVATTFCVGMSALALFVALDTSEDLDVRALMLGLPVGLALSALIPLEARWPPARRVAERLKSATGMALLIGLFVLGGAIAPEDPSDALRQFGAGVAVGFFVSVLTMTWFRFLWPRRDEE